MQKIEQRYWWEYGEEKTRINCTSADLKDKFLFLSFSARCRERLQTVICCLKCLRRFKCGMHISRR